MARELVAEGAKQAMLETPTRYTLVAAGAEGTTRLNAFDNALLAAGIGDLNLLRVSSVLPPNAEHVTQVAIAPGSLVPTAYGAIESDHAGELISAAVGVGIGETGQSGVIMEFSGRCSRQEAEHTVRSMVQEAFRQRQRPLVEVRVAAAEHRVEHMGCALAAVALWYA